MDSFKNTPLPIALQAAIAGGEKIMEVYNSTFTVEYKDDKSPLTLADKQAHEAIVMYLHKTGIPVLSEEGKDIPFTERHNWKKLWIVDPLDGTKEFIKRNGEFTVNIALVEDGFPVLGVIFVPVTGEIYFAMKEEGAFKNILSTNAGTIDPQNVINSAKRLRGSSKSENCRIVASRSHMSPETEKYIEEKRNHYKSIQLVSKGSSLKFCLVADNLADCYPRFAPTMEWDTAAGQIIVEEAGKRLTDIKTGERMRYNREQLLNNWFLVE